MVGALIRPTFPIRCAAFLTALALILPLPARCLGCVADSSNCSHCATQASAAKASPAKSCCARNSSASQHLATNNSCDRVQARTCGCSIQPVDRTLVASEQHSTLPELLAALPSVELVISDSTQSQLQSAPAFASLPPPVPHRILHCSWVI